MEIRVINETISTEIIIKNFFIINPCKKFECFIQGTTIPMLSHRELKFNNIYPAFSSSLQYSIRKDLMHPFRQLGQDDLPSSLQALNISLVINQFNEYRYSSLLT
ncbi:hypothetical protein ACEOXG_001900 [Enterobacter hormaechei]